MPSPDIVPRWEWRGFAGHFGLAEARIRAAGEPRTRHSSEIYLPCLSSSDNTKIRSELLDIKRLQAVDRNGLELWQPVMKSGFPLPREQAELVHASWGLRPPPEELEWFPYGRFMEAVTHMGTVAVVPVTKERATWLIQGAAVELSDLRIGETPARTVCVEHEDPDLVWRIVRQLGLAHLPNVSYLAAIRLHLGWE